jgi:hypothetical protein
VAGDGDGDFRGDAGAVVYVVDARPPFSGREDEAAVADVRPCGDFLLIAGTVTPFLLVNLSGAWGWCLFSVSWALAVAGVALKCWLTGLFRVGSTLR